MDQVFFLAISWVRSALSGRRLPEFCILFIMHSKHENSNTLSGVVINNNWLVCSAVCMDYREVSLKLKGSNAILVAYDLAKSSSVCIVLVFKVENRNVQSFFY
jgi:hypothetical protein